MNKVEKIKAEIKKRYKDNQADGYTDVCEELFDLCTFIDSLEEEPVSNDLEEAAWTYYDKNKPLIPHELDLHKEIISFFIAGAQWEKERDQSTIELAEDHAYLAGQEKIIDKACNWLADNYSKYIITNGLSTIFSATIDFDTIRMIEDFKKAMEE